MSEIDVGTAPLVHDTKDTDAMTSDSNKHKTVFESPVVLRVSRTVKVAGEEPATDVTTDVIEIRQFATQPAIVKFSYPIKISLEFQSAGIEIGLDLPCYREEVEDGIKEAVAIVVAGTKELLPEVEKVLDRLVEQALDAKVAIARGKWSPSYKK